jgi:hypothetical protein
MLAALVSRYRDVPPHLVVERRIEVAGLGLSALALVLLGLVVISALGASQVARIAPSDDAIAVAPAFRDENVDAEASLAIRARPVFWRSRRPEEPLPADALTDAGEEKAAKLKPLKFKVAGVFGAGSEDAGFIAVSEDRVRRIRLGESIEGWTVARIEPTAVELAGGGERRVVSMERRPVVAPESVQNADALSAAARAAAAARGGVEAGRGSIPDTPDPNSVSAEPPRLSLGGSLSGGAPPSSRGSRESR